MPGLPTASTDTCAPAGYLMDRRGGVRLENGGRGPELACAGDRLCGHVDGHDARAERHPHQHRRQPNAAATVDSQPLAGLEATVRDDGAVCGGEPTAERGSGDHVEAVRQAHQVRVGGVHGHQLGERPGAGETGLGLLRAHVRVPCLAAAAPPAAAHEGHGDPIAHRPAVHLRADRVHGAGKLMARHVRQGHRFVPHPGVPVRPAHPRGTHPHDHPVHGADGVRPLAEERRRSGSGVADGEHQASVAREASGRSTKSRTGCECRARCAGAAAR